jgi:5-methylcytosine-specific restriction endonuclease McrA
MPTRLCLQSQCPEPATYRGRCATHARAREKQTHGNKSIYNSKRWKVLRRSVLFNHPLCECGEIATDVHHIQDIEKGGDPWARDNLMALCHRCHSKITRHGMGT